jgi:tetratricopeptide (TPR) repeat protein
MFLPSGAASFSVEEADTLSFCWMPAIEDFVAREGGRKRRRRRRGSREGEEEEEEEEEEGLPRKSYHDTLLLDRTYHNPHALEGMAAVYGLLPAQRQHRSFLLPSPLPPPPQVKAPFYCEEIRNLQNKLYADGKVAAGVERNRQGLYQEAIKLYEQALSSCPDHVDALVAQYVFLPPSLPSPSLTVSRSYPCFFLLVLLCALPPSMPACLSPSSSSSSPSPSPSYSPSSYHSPPSLLLHPFLPPSFHLQSIAPGDQ